MCICGYITACTMPFKIKVTRARYTQTDEEGQSVGERAGRDDLHDLGQALSRMFVGIWESVQNLTELHPTTDQMSNRVRQVFMDALQRLLDTLTDNECDVDNVKQGSIIVYVRCASVSAVEKLYHLLNSGHLRRMFEDSLLTDEVLEDLGLWSASLRVSYREIDYLRCRTNMIKLQTGKCVV